MKKDLKTKISNDSWDAKKPYVFVKKRPIFDLFRSFWDFLEKSQSQISSLTSILIYIFILYLLFFKSNDKIEIRTFSPEEAINRENCLDI